MYGQLEDGYGIGVALDDIMNKESVLLGDSTKDVLEYAGILLYALYNHKTLRLLAWAGMSFLGEFLLTYLQVRRLPDFTFAQMFTVYYEWLGIFAVVLMLLYNGKRGRGCKPLFYIFYPAHVYILYALSCLTYMRML